MDMSIGEEEIQTNLAAKSSSVSAINIGSMVVDISIPVKKTDYSNCKHFSIRKYVAELREKRKTCEIFGSGTGYDKVEQFPPMIIPKYRYWRCECEAGSKCWQSVLESEGPFGPTCGGPTCVETAVTLPDVQPGSAIDIPTHVSPSGTQTNIIQTSLSAEKGETVKCFEKGASSSNHVEREYTGNKNGLLCIEKQKDVGESLDYAVVPCKELVAQTVPDIRDISTQIEVNKCLEIVTVNQDMNTSEDAPEILHNPLGISAITSTTQEEERENISSDSEGTQNTEDLNSLTRRKPRKVRLLVDLLSTKDVSGSDRTSKAEASSHILATRPTLVSREVMGPHEELGKGKEKCYRKRKTSILDESRSIEIRGLPNVTKKARSTRVGLEKTQKTSEIVKDLEETRPKVKNDGYLKLFKNKSCIQGGLDHVISVTDNFNVGSSSGVKGKSSVLQNGLMDISPASYRALLEVPNENNRELSFSERDQVVENKESSKVCLDLSLGRPVSAEIVAKEKVFQSNSHYLERHDRFSGFPILNNGNIEHLRNNISPMEKDLTWDLGGGRIAHRTGISLEKQINSSESAKRGIIWREKMDGNGKKIEDEGLRRQNNQRGSKAFENQYSDDIPMEIVELMAKNQYERQMAGKQVPSLSKRNDEHQHQPIKWLHNQPPTTVKFPTNHPFNFFASSSTENRQKVPFPVSVSGSHPNEAATAPPSWMSNTNKSLPFGLGMPHQFTNMGDNMESPHKGRTISDFKPAEKVNYSRSSLDPYANETIPAMHLLSLMNKGISPNTPFDSESNRFLSSSRGFTFDGRQNIPDRSFALHQHHGPGPGTGTGNGPVYFTGEGSSRTSPSFSTDFTGQMSWGPPVRNTLKNLSRGDTILKTMSQLPFPRKEMQGQDRQRGIFGASNSRQCDRYFPRFIDLQADNLNGNGTGLMSNETLKMEECVLNRNPADFSLPEPGNEYTINGRDLKFPRKDFYRERLYSGNVDGRKRQRQVKESTGKKIARPRAT